MTRRWSKADRRPLRKFRADDNVGKPCPCLECQAAGVSDRPLRFIPANEFNNKPHWAHGIELKRWLEAYERAQDDMRALRDKLGLDPKKLAEGLERNARSGQ